MFRNRHIVSVVLTCAFLSIASQASRAQTIWTVDATQSSLQLSLPNQPVTFNGQSYGNAFVTNQGGGSGIPWVLGRTAPISGTIASNYQDGTSIEFLAGQPNLTALNSGSYRPDPANWTGSNYSFPNDPAPAAFGGQLGVTSTPFLPVVIADVIRFSIREIEYDLASGTLPISAGSFAANQTTFGMADGQWAAGIAPTVSGLVYGELAPLADAGVNILGGNGAAVGTITAPNPLQPNLRELTLPISIPMTLNLDGGAVSQLNGSASGVIVAYTMVPEPSSLVLAGIGLAIACWIARQGR